MECGSKLDGTGRETNLKEDNGSWYVGFEMLEVLTLKIITFKTYSGIIPPNMH